MQPVEYASWKENQEDHIEILIYSSNTTYMQRFTSILYHTYIIPLYAFQIMEYNEILNTETIFCQRVEVGDVFWKLSNLSEVLHLENFFFFLIGKMTLFSLGMWADALSQNFWNHFLVPASFMTLRTLKYSLAQGPALATVAIPEAIWTSLKQGARALTCSCGVSQSGCTFRYSGSSLHG